MSYMLYKNVTYVLITFWFGCFCGFSGQTLILDVACQSFYVLYTNVSSFSASKFPYLYGLGQKNMLLARRVFWPWILNGVWHSIVIFFVASWAFEVFGLTCDCYELGKKWRTYHLRLRGIYEPCGGCELKVIPGDVHVDMALSSRDCGVYTFVVCCWISISQPNVGFSQDIGEMEYLIELPTLWLVCLCAVFKSHT
ncbi:hypothetical protein PsorP6_001681 [Peronosclerospora sorghi]|uniref:Uncharacterized protein n=1 Tax=Peronosclerospora sorghi TaxID=230839 RepID=A0ACC0WWA6_9STRA|nr:hypothetical protein PsorP6_001681 [Peronosclerospora sorghi]